MTSTRQTGTLSLTKGDVHQEMRGTLIRTYRGDIDFQIEGCELHNSFRAKDGWTFTPDKPALPTEPGYYTTRDRLQRNSTPTIFAAILHLTRDGQWTAAPTSGNARPGWAHTHQEMLESGDLVRLALVVAVD